MNQNTKMLKKLELTRKVKLRFTAFWFVLNKHLYNTDFNNLNAYWKGY